MNPTVPVTDYGQNYRIMQEWDNGTVNPCEKEVENLRRTLALGSLSTWGILWPLGNLVADVKKYRLNFRRILQLDQAFCYRCCEINAQYYC